MRIAITGADGMLGRALQRCCPQHELMPLSRHQCEVTDREDVFSVLREMRPALVIHCAAYTAVDRAESEVEQCRLVNVYGTENVASACREINAALMLLSTDYVFDGAGVLPFETDSPRGALNVYGQSKADAEDIASAMPRHYIIRTSWMFGSGRNFIKTILRIAKEKTELPVVCDQVGSPTYAEDLAPVLLRLGEMDAYGIYHITNEGFCSWADLAEEAILCAGLSARVKRVRSGEYPVEAIRPLNSRLSKVSMDLAGLNRLPTWQNAVNRYIDLGRMAE